MKIDKLPEKKCSVRGGDTNRVSKVITTHHGYILLLQKKKNGLFELPGGHIMVGEDPASAAKREFFEETGVDVKNIKRITSNSKRVLYSGNINTSNIKISKEHKSFKFVNTKDMFKLPLSKWTKKDLSLLKPRSKAKVDIEVE